MTTWWATLPDDPLLTLKPGTVTLVGFGNVVMLRLVWQHCCVSPDPPLVKGNTGGSQRSLSGAADGRRGQPPTSAT